MNKLYYEKKQYKDTSTGEMKEAINYYVLYGEIKVQLRPNDFTGREILRLMVNEKKIQKGD